VCVGIDLYVVGCLVVEIFDFEVLKKVKKSANTKGKSCGPPLKSTELKTFDFFSLLDI
jgi:hypothetical protein